MLSRLARYPAVAVDEDANKRDIDEPTMLAKQAREAAEKQANDLRASRMSIEVEPPTIYRP
jgi:hypothetical protein